MCRRSSSSVHHNTCHTRIITTEQRRKGASAAVALSDIVPYQPSSASLSSPTTSHTSHYRTLTSTAAERKQTVAACRALRAQITRFEEAFIQLHGRPPKGAAERAPLATTYAQYREWKRAIRADAACRIQALFRGARTRCIVSGCGVGEPIGVTEDAVAPSVSRRRCMGGDVFPPRLGDADDTVATLAIDSSCSPLP